MAPYYDDRPGPPYFVTIHTGEGILRASDMADYLDDNPGASAHAMVDAATLIANPDPRTVPYDDAAYTAGGRANDYGLHIELCAFAHMTREQWLSEQDVNLWVPWVNNGAGGWRLIRSPMSMLRRAAGWVRDVATRYGIALRKINAADLRAGRSGICGHADTSAAWNQTDHTDPGVGFPWDVFIALVVGTVQPEPPKRKRRKDMANIVVIKCTRNPDAQVGIGFAIVVDLTNRRHRFNGDAGGLDAMCAASGTPMIPVSAAEMHEWIGTYPHPTPPAKTTEVKA